MFKIKILENIQEKSVESVEKNDTETLKRISDEHVGYMELYEKAGSFSCGNCKWIKKEDYCEHPDVEAHVSKEYGCCNYFYPKNGKVKFPKNSKPRK